MHCLPLLRILQVNRNLEEATRRFAKVPTINTDSLLVIKYPAGIINWAKEEIEAAGIETKKLPTHWVVPPQIQHSEAAHKAEIREAEDY